MKQKITHWLIAAWMGTLLMAPALAQEEETAPEEPVHADELVLTNGSRIVGTVLGARDGVVQFETDFAGTLEIGEEMIVSIESAEPITIALEDYTLLESRTLTRDEDSVRVVEASGSQQEFSLDQALILNPEPWEIGQGYNWTGLVAFAFAIERGNSKTDELDYKLETSWRSDDDRYTLKMNGEVDEANDTKNADNWIIQGKYDNFFSDVSYWGLQASAEQDEFADLDLRAIAGPYVGRDFYTDPLFALSAELGVSYVDEDFITAPDQDYPGANWALRISSNYLGGDSTLYLDQRGVWNLDETSDVIIDTAFGLGFPLLFGLEAAAEILLEYDSGAVEGVEELDESYNFRIGYSW